MNRMQYELSPYLGRWADDPVDWCPWGQEAFDRAEREKKPVFISIGTTPAQGQMRCDHGTVARLTERYFVPVQVDAQEYPAVASLYRQAAALLTGETDTPLEVLADWTGNPFYVTHALGEVELAALLSGVALHWNSDPSAYRRTAEALGGRLSRMGETMSAPARQEQLWETHFAYLQSRYDKVSGGFGGGAKSLMPQELLFLLAYHRYTGDPAPLKMAEHTLRQMALGGVRDVIGGGFFRGSTDAAWQHPIPEKRLIDQAWMLESYTRAYQATGRELFRAVATEIADFVIRELRHAAGGFYTAQWSEDGYYHLKASQVVQALGETDAAVFCRQYSVGDAPTIPRLREGETPEEDTLLLHDLRMKLYRFRLERGSPERDEKVLVGWNGIMIAALARTGRVLGVKRYLTAAANAEEFVRNRLVSHQELRRYWCHGTAAGDGALEDYAGYAMGLYELYRCGCGGEYLRHGAKVMARADALFSDWNNGGYFLTRACHNLPTRPKQLWDTDLPAPWSIALQVLVALSKEIRHPGLRNRTKDQLEYAASVARSYDCAYALAAMMEAKEK